MLKQLHLKIIFLMISLLGAVAFAVVPNTSLVAQNAIYLDKAKIVSQQIDLLKARLDQAKNELKDLQKNQDTFLSKLTIDRVSKPMLNQLDLDIAEAKSNLNGITIELYESQQTVTRLEKGIQEIQNQLNIFNIFGLKTARNGASNLIQLRQELTYQNDLLQLEKNRVFYLLQLQSIADSVLQLYNAKYNFIDSLLKSQTVVNLKEQQTKSETGFQQQQVIWLQHLNDLNEKLTKLQLHKSPNKHAIDEVQHEIFYVKENLNFTYIQILIARYEDQIQQLKSSVSRSNSITLLSKSTDQVQLLSRQLIKLDTLLKSRIDILTKRQTIFARGKNPPGSKAVSLNELEAQYQKAADKVASLNKDLVNVRKLLDRSLQQELSARQGLPGMEYLGAEILLIPGLAFQVVKSLSFATVNAFYNFGYWGWFLLALFEFMWIAVIVGINYLLKRIVAGLSDHEFGHINLKWLIFKTLHQNLIDIAVLGNVLGIFFLLGIPLRNFNFLMKLASVWLLFKSFIIIARLCLVETVHDKAGHDVRLYHQLKRIFLFGGVVTALTVFIHQLPIVYEVKDLFNRLFLVFLLVGSLFLLTQWRLVPGLILPHIDERRTYLKRIVKLLGLLVPLILLVNSIVGLFGFVNLVLTISWYESIFILVLVGYLVIRGLLNEGMDLASKLLIRHVTNGWLWMEAFLKPIDRILHVFLFLTAWAGLFLLYGWDSQSPVVERLNNLLNYPLVHMLNTSINFLNIIELVIVVSLLYWAARWTREFVYRMLLSRTKDLGLRNSIAIISQYTMVVIGIFVCLRVLGIDFQALTFVATGLAFGVGLGLRDLVNNFACGFLLLFERPLRVGDIISIGEYEGEVIHIGGRAVAIRTWDRFEVLIPNADLFNKLFTNWTAKDNIVRTVISIKINRHDSPHDVQAIILQALQECKDVLSDPLPEVFVKELADGLIEFEVRYFINLRQVKSRVGTRSDVLVAIWDAFEKYGIQPPYPQREVYVKNV